MEPLLFVMAILGCGEDDAACRELRIEPARYHSEAACLEASEAALMRSGDLPYPTVVAQCRRAGASVQPLRGSEVMLPDAENSPQRPPRLADVRAPRRRDR